ncbi:hypothetical protein LAZ67_4003455 [Cordylochernes scorpioides]|uniref:Reverse transcriptase domain-containing protein n=1 Tax=Cordylochernes scorpioides TaxID=51811 RepID=A0ABY6KID4_9ARAC|nr:hypothetical protein LAZ67_4003455 [Cordylochernes scorpioides]
MQIIPPDIPKSPSHVYYLSHQYVLKEESTTTKFRVVFVLVLNYKQASLTSIKVRTFPVALSADIEKYYRQILIHPDRNSASDAIQEYRLTTVTYGTTFAPYLAIRTLHQLADDEAMNYPVASKIVKRDFYVDDLLTGEDAVEEAQIIAFLVKEGFPIRKWMYNRQKLLDSLPEDLKDTNQSFDFKDDPSVKILGILWDLNLDSFAIRVMHPDVQVYSKQSFLSLIARIYDPFDWIAPLVIIFKIMLEKLWSKGCNWDEKLFIYIQQHNGQALYIPCKSIQALDFHGFCDSSEMAYAAVIYVKSGCPNQNLIFTPPRTVFRFPSLNSHFDQIFLWTDPTIVLNWIISESKRWNTFVANRVSVIQRTTTLHSWLHVPRSENPANLATRGISPSQLVDNQLWWQEPDWLQVPSGNYYLPLHSSDELSTEALIEERSTILIYHSIMGPLPK